MEAPKLSQKDMDEYLALAQESPRRRYAKILHKPGDELNRAFNFLMTDTYMQPHHHPSKEKIENIKIIEGKIAVLFFDDQGNVKKTTVLEPNGKMEIDVPAFTWHTYVVLSDHAITYETMMGVYDPTTWKAFAEWAPQESATEHEQYLDSLKRKAAAAL
jgi:cupin fold WbuC family metalloprotein